MPRYKVHFSRMWITGRWGFTDRVLHEIGGRPTDPSLLQPAWVVNFKGSSIDLGRYLTQALKVPLGHNSWDGTVFDIQEIDPGKRPSARRRNLPPRGTGSLRSRFGRS